MGAEIFNGQAGLAAGQELLDGQADVLRDLPEEDGRNVAAGMKGDGGGPSVQMAELPVGAALPHLGEP
jgi:hypothetical protein